MRGVNGRPEAIFISSTTLNRRGLSFQFDGPGALEEQGGRVAGVDAELDGEDYRRHRQPEEAGTGGERLTSRVAHDGQYAGQDGDEHRRPTPVGRNLFPDHGR
jgi:hypothetical protein